MTTGKEQSRDYSVSSAESERQPYEWIDIHEEANKLRNQDPNEIVSSLENLDTISPYQKALSRTTRRCNLGE